LRFDDLGDGNLMVGASLLAMDLPHGYTALLASRRYSGSHTRFVGFSPPWRLPQAQSPWM